MKTLLLTSSGIPEDLKDLFLSLLPKSPEEISVSYIITAAFGQGEYKSWIDLCRKQLQGYGINDIENLDIRDKNEKELEAILSKKDVICVNGGNTFYLLKYMKANGCDNVITELVDGGKLYVGVSAGSYIACPTIEQAHWKNQDRDAFGMTDLTALSLVPFLISAHFTEEMRPFVKKGAKASGYPAVALHDGQAVLLQGEKVSIVGKGEREFFNGFSEQD